jgi:secreted Zn-dependent insulinase-like peptidase
MLQNKFWKPLRVNCGFKRTIVLKFPRLLSGLDFTAKSRNSQFIFINSFGYGREVRTMVLADLWDSLLNDHLREFNYLASQAKLNFSFNMAPSGF